jgi:hypothetical protein
VLVGAAHRHWLSRNLQFVHLPKRCCHESSLSEWNRAGVTVRGGHHVMERKESPERWGASNCRTLTMRPRMTSCRLRMTGNRGRQNRSDGGGSQGALSLMMGKANWRRPGTSIPPRSVLLRGLIRCHGRSRRPPADAAVRRRCQCGAALVARLSQVRDLRRRKRGAPPPTVIRPKIIYAGVPRNPVYQTPSR